MSARKDERLTTRAKEAARSLVKAAPEVLAGSAGAVANAVTVAHLGPGAVALGHMVGKGAEILLLVGRDYVTRQLASRERARLDRVLALAAQKAQQMDASGSVLRQDWFTGEDGTPGEEAYEILEGLLRRVQQEHEQRRFHLLVCK